MITNTTIFRALDGQETGEPEGRLLGILTDEKFKQEIANPIRDLPAGYYPRKMYNTDIAAIILRNTPTGFGLDPVAFWNYEEQGLKIKAEPIGAVASWESDETKFQNTGGFIYLISGTNKYQSTSFQFLLSGADANRLWDRVMALKVAAMER